jgi:dextranase
MECAMSSFSSGSRTSLGAWPTRAQLRPGEPLEIALRADPRETVGIRVLDVDSVLAECTIGPGAPAPAIELPPNLSRAGLAIEVRDSSGGRATTAIDIAPHWSVAPRYGAFSDFAPDEPVAESVRRATEFLRLHVNVVQFYDWMASHHTFRAQADEFIDPLGRPLSHAVVRRKVGLAHAAGAAALAYGALYGAETEFSRHHPDWLLYDGRGEPMVFAEIFCLQDFSEGSPWRPWILNQYEDALRFLEFDGIHIDQYGYPKRARSRARGPWREIDVAAEFPGFVEEAARRLLTLRPDGGSIFNCVNAWPLDAMPAVASDAATYIEVWEPHSRYRDLYELVRRARTLRPDKAVILAAYLRPFHPDQVRSGAALTAFRLAAAAIGAAGGFHLVSAEGDGLLSEAYYPRYGRLTADEADAVRRYADFAVRNTTRLHDHTATDIAWTHVGPTNSVITLAHPELGDYGAGAQPGSLWVVGRIAGRETVLQLVNLRGLTSDAWNAEQTASPKPLEDVEVRVRVVGGIDGVWWDSPDDAIGCARAIPFEITDLADGRYLVFKVPRIDMWTSVWWRDSEAEGAA